MFLATVSFMVMGPSTSPTTPACLLPWPVPQPGEGRGSSWTVRSHQLLGDPKTFSLKDDTPWDTLSVMAVVLPPPWPAALGPAWPRRVPAQEAELGEKGSFFVFYFPLVFDGFPLSSQQDQMSPGEGQKCADKSTAEGGVTAALARTL